MIDVLCGNKNAQLVLLYLYVNCSCYAKKLQRSFNTSLTPIQRALHRLEKAGIIMSHYEGKTRLYQFNPIYPLLPELKELLKKAYTLLPADQKKRYYIKTLPALQKSSLFSFWERLLQVKKLVVHAKSKTHERHGEGQVDVLQQSDTTLIFKERGFWKMATGQIDFHSSFRWTFDYSTSLLSLEHLRHGLEHPVFLFHLAHSSPGILASIDSHLCEADTYLGQLIQQPDGLQLRWRVIGPSKDDEIDYCYKT